MLILLNLNFQTALCTVKFHLCQERVLIVFPNYLARAEPENISKNALCFMFFIHHCSASAISSPVNDDLITVFLFKMLMNFKQSAVTLRSLVT